VRAAARRRPWEPAWEEALFGPDGFYRRPEGPAGHFRTASHAAPLALASALLRLAREAGCTAIVDVGAGRGELLRALAAVDDEGSHRLSLHGVDLVERPAALPARVGWTCAPRDVPPAALAGALVVAWELLDTVPCPVLEVAGDGTPRTVLVDVRTGEECLGGPALLPDLDWCRRWWPLDGAAEGARAEVGRRRDERWAALAGAVAGSGTGLLLAVDYAHTLAGRPPLGTLAGYRRGRLVPPVADGTCDITAHVAVDAVEAAGRAAGAAPGILVPQHEVLRALGVTPYGPGTEEVLDPGGLGGFTWLLQAVGGSTWSPG
jgi:SAM-dependent MidA family methyltransferase